MTNIEILRFIQSPPAMFTTTLDETWQDFLESHPGKTRRHTIASVDRTPVNLVIMGSNDPSETPVFQEAENETFDCGHDRYHGVCPTGE